MFEIVWSDSLPSQYDARTLFQSFPNILKGVDLGDFFGGTAADAANTAAVRPSPN